MKTLITLSGSLIIMMALKASAADHENPVKSDKPATAVTVAPFIWGNPEENAPIELKNVKAKYASVPVAPFFPGDANEIAPSDLITDVQIPLAPFVWGDPEEEAPQIE